MWIEKKWLWNWSGRFIGGKCLLVSLCRGTLKNAFQVRKFNWKVKLVLWYIISKVSWKEIRIHLQNNHICEWKWLWLSSENSAMQTQCYWILSDNLTPNWKMKWGVHYEIYCKQGYRAYFNIKIVFSSSKWLHIFENRPQVDLQQCIPCDGIWRIRNSNFDSSRIVTFLKIKLKKTANMCPLYICEYYISNFI
jgi:hypothetical protein